MDRGSHLVPSSGDSANVGNHFEKKSDKNDEFHAINKQSYVFDYEDLHLRKGKWTVSCLWSSSSLSPKLFQHQIFDS